MQSRIGSKLSFLIFFGFSTITSLPLVFVSDNTLVIMVSVFCSRFGIAASYSLASYLSSELFPTLFVSFAMSAFTVAGKSASVAAPQVAELGKPLPMLFFIVMGITGLMVSLLIKQVKEDKPSLTKVKVLPKCVSFK